MTRPEMHLGAPEHLAKLVAESNSVDLTLVSDLFRHAERRKRRLRVTLGLTSIAAVIGVYAAISYAPSSNRVLVPTPGSIVRFFGHSIGNGLIPSALGASLMRVALGYGIGCALAVLVGSLRGWFAVVGYILDPIIDCMRPVPALAYIPLVILWFGIGESSRVLVIAVASFLSCVVSVTAGMREVPQVYVDAARTLGGTRRQVFLTVAVPVSIPYIFAGLRVALGAAWGTLVAAELIAAQNGLGFLLQSGQQFFNTKQVISALVVIGVIGFLMDAVLQLVQGRIARW